MHIFPQPSRSVGACVGACVGLALLAAACNTESTVAPTDHSSVHAVLGAAATDTIEAPLVQALIVEVRDENGNPASGMIVRFDALAPTDPARRTDRAVFVCALTTPLCGLPGTGTLALDSTDASGRARAVVRLGRVVGRAVVRFSVPELGAVDSATFTVLPGAAAHIRTTTDTALVFGATATLRARVVDRYENIRPDATTASATAGPVIALDAATGVVTAREMGTASVLFRSGSLVDSTIVRVVPPGRLVALTPSRVVQLVNTDGSTVRTVATNVTSGLGVFPRFDGTRQRVTFQSGTSGAVTTVVVVDTSGAPRRDIDPTAELNSILSTRQLADGTVLVVAQRNSLPGYSLWRVAEDNELTALITLPGLLSTRGTADISPDGTRVAYIVPSAPGGIPQLRVRSVTTGVVTVVAPSASFPRWSPRGDRIAFINGPGIAVINADGSGRRQIGTATFNGGIAWSPDEAYLVGSSALSATVSSLRAVRVSDGVDVLLRFHTAAGAVEDYVEPDWR